MDTRLLPATFVELADTLVAGFDVIELMHVLTSRSVELLEVDAAGLMLADSTGQLKVLAASDDRTMKLEEYQVRAGEGPCIDCYRSGYPLALSEFDVIKNRWPRFADQAKTLGIKSVQALPMRLREQVIGAMNLFRNVPEPFSEDDTLVAQAMADVATIGLLHSRSIDAVDETNRQLQHALDSRIIIEQAKGKLAERMKLDPDSAFSMLRDYSRSHNFRLIDVAGVVIRGDTPLPGLLDA